MAMITNFSSSKSSHCPDTTSRPCLSSLFPAVFPMAPDCAHSFCASSCSASFCPAHANCERFQFKRSETRKYFGDIQPRSHPSPALQRRTNLQSAMKSCPCLFSPPPWKHFCANSDFRQLVFDPRDVFSPSV